MQCELYNDWTLIIGTCTFAVGALLPLACHFLHDNTLETAIKTQHEELKRLSDKVDKMHQMYEADMMTVLRETLCPTVTLPSESFDNNSIPAGPSGPN